MGQAILSILKALPCTECTCPCNELDLNSDCGLCKMEYHSETAPDSDSDCSVDADTLCGRVHYSKK